MSAEDFRILSANRRDVQEAIEAKLAELRGKEEEAIRAKCAEETIQEPYEWEEEWTEAGVVDLAQETESGERVVADPENPETSPSAMAKTKSGKVTPPSLDDFDES